MIVADASVVADFLIAAGGQDNLAQLIERQDVLVAPVLADLEVMNVLRKRVLRKEMTRKSADAAFANLRALRILRYPLEPLLDRIWILQANLTPYDAAYVALAESMGLILYTRDRKLARSPGHAAAIRVI